MSVQLLSPAPAHAAMPSPPNASVSVPTSSQRTGGATPGASLLALLERPIGALLLLLVAVCTIYAPTLNGQFLWDDTALVKNNLLIRSPLFGAEVFRHTLFNDESNFYRPTQTLTFIVDYWCSGLNPFGYHLTSVLIHAANAFLLCLVLRLVLPTVLGGVLDKRRSHYLALGVALVWAVHPVHSAAVAYVSGTADTLAMLFCLSAALLCDRALRSAFSGRKVAWGVAAFVCLMLGLCSKEIASIWVLLFLGYLFGLRADTPRRARWTVLAFALVALAAYLGLRHLTPPRPAPPALPEMPPKIVLMLRALGDYGSLLLFPDKLFMERQVFAAPGLANAENESFYRILGYTGALVLAAFAVGVCWPGRGRTMRRVGVAWFLTGFLPVSNLFALNASVAEHWLYLPSIGFLLFLVGVGLDLPASLRERRGAVPVLAVSLGLVIVAFGLRTWYRTFDWTDELTFFRQTIADGGDVPRARAGLAAAYGHQAIEDGTTASDGQAIAVLRDVVARFPKVLASRINLANSLARQGNTAEAKSLLEAAAADLFAHPGGDPRETVTVLKSLDLLEGSDPAWPAHRRALFHRGLQSHPDAWDLVKYGVQDQERDGHPKEALALAQRFANAHWWHAPAHFAVGQLEAQLGRHAEAVTTLTAASRLDVHDAEALSSAANLCLGDGKLDEARQFQVRAVRRQPDSPRQHVALARVLDRAGDTEGARRQIELANALVARAE